jgi:serine O-acetyltransferase
MLVDVNRWLRAPRGAALRWSEAFARLVADVRADHAMNARYDAKYGKHTMHGSLARDAIQKIGFQMMIAIRTMRFLRDARVPLGAKVMSRAIRHVYGSDIHWDAEFEPGVVIGHGFGIAISGAVRVGAGSILLQGAQIGMGIDPVTRQVGEPVLERNVHVGPHAKLLGPITIGEGSKIQAGALVTESVPARSLVTAPKAIVGARAHLAPPAPGPLETGGATGPASAASVAR